jgi:ketosteroid isomerase-like protein
MPVAATEDEIRQLGRDWTQAEESGDVATLETLTTEDFALVGPLGFVLDKQQWLDRYRSGTLVTHSLTWDDLYVRNYGETAIIIGRHSQQAAYHGHRSDGQFRATHIALRRSGQWRLAGIQLSPITQPPAPGATA